MTGEHKKHLPREDENKGVAPSMKIPARVLSRMAQVQALDTKNDARTPQRPR